MGSRSWAASGRPRGGASASGPRPRPAGSWLASIARARDAWDDLTGGPTADGGVDIGPGDIVALSPGDVAPVRLVYSDAAAAAILDTALRLWADTAASIGEDPEVDG